MLAPMISYSVYFWPEYPYPLLPSGPSLFSTTPANHIIKYKKPKTQLGVFKKFNALAGNWASPPYKQTLLIRTLFFLFFSSNSWKGIHT